MRGWGWGALGYTGYWGIDDFMLPRRSFMLPRRSFMLPRRYYLRWLIWGCYFQPEKGKLMLVNALLMLVNALLMLANTLLMLC